MAARPATQVSDLGRRAARGASVTLVAQIARMVIQIASVMVLSRLLSAEDYGLVAMVLVVVGFGEIFRDFGLSSAAIQAPDLSSGQRDNLFWANSGIGVALAAIVFGLAGPTAAVYGEPQLLHITQALAGIFVLNGMATQFRASLIRALRFRAVAATELASSLVGFGVALFCALTGLGVWALVAQQISASAFMLVAMVVLGKWIPGLPKRKVSIRKFVGFGGHLLGSQLVNYAAGNVDTWTVGMRFGPTALGFYNRAYQLLMTPLNQVRTPSTTVALPILSKLSEDTRRFDSFLTKGQLALGLPLALVLGFVAGGADAVVPVFLGPDWEESIPFLRLFAAAGLFQTLAFVGYWVYLARALTRVLLRYSLVSAAIKIAAVIVGSQWGALGVAIGFALAPAVSWPISLWWLNRATAIPVRALYVSAARIIGLAIPVGGAAFGAVSATSSSLPIVSLLAALVASIIVAAAMVSVLPPLRRDVRAVIDIARLAMSRR